MLHLHRAERTDTLVHGLAGALATAPADPFTPEVVAVPSKGVERWLAQQLSHALGPSGGDGVCANVLFPSPRVLLADALAAARGVDPAHDPWNPGRLAWMLLDVIDGCAAESWSAPLTNHLDEGPGRRLATAQRLARLYTSYAANRPRLLVDWAAGRDTDGEGTALPSDLRWQAELWRRLDAAVGTESPAAGAETRIARLVDEPALVDLPERVSIFGPTRISTVDLDLLAALAVHRQIHLWLPHPSPTLWETINDRGPARSPRRRGDQLAQPAANPLLASLGRDARELSQRLHAVGGERTDEQLPAVEPAPASLLGRLQRSVRDDIAGAASRTLDLADRSVQVHACHGAARQVEVLREVLTGLLADDPTLEPRDVLVMCPDVEDYAPLITAVFGAVDAQHAADAHPGHRLRVQLADRSLRQTNPLLDLIARLLALAGGRLTASEVLDLAACPPVRRRFGFTDDDLERLADWVATAGVRWGLDACHREPFELGALAQNTWRAGLDRILLGAAMAEDRLRWIGVTLPLDDVASTDIDLAGRLAELVDRLGGVLDRLTGSHPLSHWLDTLTGALDLLGGVADAEAWQSAQARRELAEARVDAADHADALLLTVGDVQALLADRLAGRPTRANFRAGTLTVCSMVPMRSVPHRAVCLLGLDDGVFPRDAGTDGDDVLARDPCIGERDPKSEDRQLLLDAVLAAREHLVVCYTGADPRTNTARPPAVPVTEILDAVDSLATTADGRPAREQVVVHHPLQPFDARNFTYGDLGAVDRSFSFDRVAWRGAERAALPREEPAAFLPRPLPDADQYGDVDLGDLARWVEHPCRGFLRQRLAVSLPGDDEQIDDSLAVALDGLARWRVGDRLLADHLAGASAEDCRQAEWRRGTLPPGELGRRELDRTIAEVEPITAAAAPLLTAGSEAVDVVAGVHDRRVVGTVPGVRGDCVVRAVFSRLSAQHRLRAWVQLLALAVSEPDVAWTAVTVGRGAGDGDVARSALGPVDAEQARRSLAALVGLRDRGLCMPLPIPAKTSAAYAAARRSGMSVANAAIKAEQVWQERYPENAEPEHVLVWGENAALDRLRSSPADGAGGDEETLLGQLARQLWQPLLDAETLESP